MGLKFATARRFASVGTVLSAFGALALGGAFSLWGALCLFGLIVLALALEGRLSHASVWPTAALACLLAALMWLFWTDALELAVAMSTFAVALTAQRLLVRKSAADDPTLFLTTFLMLAGGAALTAELLFALCFIAFAICGTTALVLSHLERVASVECVPNSTLESLLSRRLIAAVASLSVASLVVAVGLFFLFPRMTAGAFVRKNPLGAQTGLTDKIRLDDAGLIKSDPRPALRVKLSPDDLALETLDIHWRGRVFEKVDGNTWRRGDVEAKGKIAALKATPEVNVVALAEEDSSSESDSATREAGEGSDVQKSVRHRGHGRREMFPLPRLRVGPVSHEPPALTASVEVFPASGHDVAFVPENSRWLKRLRPQHPTGFRRSPPAFFLPSADDQVATSRSLAEGFIYEVELDDSASKSLRDGLAPRDDRGVRGGFAIDSVWDASAFDLPALTAQNSGLDLYKNALVPSVLLELPDDLDQRIVDLAHRLTRNESSLTGKVRALESHLRQFTYGTSTPISPSGSPLSDFLFVTQKGHCELFATAMATMLRVVGIPSRTVGGFYGGDRTDEGDYVVRLASAHAWVEVFIPQMGFVTVDPTPPEGRSPQTSPVITWLSDTYDRLSKKWNRTFVDLTLWDQWRALRTVGRSLSSAFSRGISQLQSLSSNEGHLPFFRRIAQNVRFMAPMTILFFAIVFIGVCRIHSRRHGTSSPKRGASHRLIRALEKKMARLGFVRRPNETIRELMTRAAGEGCPIPPSVNQVVSRCLEVRFGGENISKSQERTLMKVIRSKW